MAEASFDPPDEYWQVDLDGSYLHISEGEHRVLLSALDAGNAIHCLTDIFGAVHHLVLRFINETKYCSPVLRERIMFAEYARAEEAEAVRKRFPYLREHDDESYS